MPQLPAPRTAAVYLVLLSGEQEVRFVRIQGVGQRTQGGYSLYERGVHGAESTTAS